MVKKKAFPFFFFFRLPFGIECHSGLAEESVIRLKTSAQFRRRREGSVKSGGSHHDRRNKRGRHLKVRAMKAPKRGRVGFSAGSILMEKNTEENASQPREKLKTSRAFLHDFLRCFSIISALRALGVMKTPVHYLCHENTEFENSPTFIERERRFFDNHDRS